MSFRNTAASFTLTPYHRSVISGVTLPVHDTRILTGLHTYPHCEYPHERHTAQPSPNSMMLPHSGHSGEMSSSDLIGVRSW